MPPSKIKGRRIVKRYKKRTSSRRLSSTKKLVKLIKKVSLKQAETKHTHYIQENLQLNHNTPRFFEGQLWLTQGNTDDGSGTSFFAARIGDEIVAKGLSFKFWFANKLDRPNVMYKITFFKYQSSSVASIPLNAPYFAQGTTNYMIRDLDTETYKIIKTVKFNLQTSAQRITAADTFNGAEGHRSVNVWIPLGNKKIQYMNSSSIPRFLDIGFTVVCYDSYGTLTTDNIASFAYTRKLYFKDP